MSGGRCGACWRGSQSLPVELGKTGVSAMWRARRLVVARLARLRTRSPALDLVVLQISPPPGSRATVWVISTVPASRSIWFQTTARGFADADAGGEYEGGRVGEVGLYGVLVGGQALVQEDDFLGGEGSGGFLGGASMASTSRVGLMAMPPEMTAWQILAAGAPAWSLILVRTVSRRGVVASPLWSSPMAGRNCQRPPMRLTGQVGAMTAWRGRRLAGEVRRFTA